MDALIFDFDGVIADTEPLHFQGFMEVLADRGIRLTEDAYYEKYAGFDDRDGFGQILRDNGIDPAPDRIEDLTRQKTRLVCRNIQDSLSPIPGAVALIRAASDAEVPLAVCSGALRNEIDLAAASLGIRECFAVVVAAEDVPRGKPDPEGYYKARRLLAEHCKRVVAPGRCVVCEDTPAGIAAARGAGMRVCGLTTTNPADRLSGAALVIADFTDITLGDLELLVE